ncbi:leucine-rich repeat domain-containing protein [bacterium]|nr:leucine-rich repeat domain-containing protein [bacterium]MBU1989669.1 leucine-rich repeat domain-containing protein [bacterium]
MIPDKNIVKLFNWAKKYQVDDILENRETLQSLKSLDLSYRLLSSLPSEIFLLTSLEELDISHNNLKELPADITKLKSLKLLNISWNHITHNLDFLPTNIKINSAWNRS